MASRCYLTAVECLPTRTGKPTFFCTLSKWKTIVPPVQMIFMGPNPSLCSSLLFGDQNFALASNLKQGRQDLQTFLKRLSSCANGDTALVHAIEQASRCPTEFGSYNVCLLEPCDILSFTGSAKAIKARTLELAHSVIPEFYEAFKEDDDDWYRDYATNWRELGLDSLSHTPELSKKFL